MEDLRKPGSGLKITLFNKPAIPGKIIVALKALILFVVIIQHRFIITSFSGLPFLPFLNFLDSLPPIFYTFTTTILILSCLSVLLKIGNYLNLSLLTGLIILFYIVSSKPLFGNSTTFLACLLILIGFYKGDSTLFRVQLSLLYLGAAVNKLFNPDWWNGMYFDFFLREVFNVTLYQSWISTDNLAVAKILGITTILSEFFLGFIVLIPKLTRLTILTGLIFHGGMLVFTSGELSVRFLYIMSAAFLLISNVKIKPIRIEQRSKFFSQLLRYFDLSDSLTVKNCKKNSFQVTINSNSYKGRQAYTKLFLSTQFMLSYYFLGIILYMISGMVHNKIISPVITLFRDNIIHII